MKLRQSLVATLTAVLLAAGYLLTGSASASAGPQAAQQLQNRVDAYIEKHPEAQQISADTLKIPGGTVTLAAPGTDRTNSPTAISCSNYYLCIQDGYGDRYNYYTCGLYSFSGLGDGVFNNNQSSGTVARFYNSDRSLRWTNTAKDTGTASWTPVYYIRPC
ncbi:MULTISPECIES: hypothetical protein [Streptomyces]|uniref:Secreted protein n=1 Tax=Streptomyces chilikensis TaxID=1194079 RepID=A0ABV3EIZ8_9ACTN|nr:MULTISPECIES: hypothetical protein [Streptomyces]MDH6229024.1 hypothetical protein [Streptomyces sp. MJP52]